MNERTNRTGYEEHNVQQMHEPADHTPPATVELPATPPVGEWSVAPYRPALRRTAVPSRPATAPRASSVIQQ